MRTTKRMLETRLLRINTRLGTEFSLNTETYYGGYELTTENGNIIHYRIPAREMLKYLDGLLTGMDMQEWGAYT